MRKTPWGQTVELQHKINLSMRERASSILQRGKFVFAGFAWLGCVIGGFWLLLDHDTKPGTSELEASRFNTSLVRRVFPPIPLEWIRDLIPPEGTLHVIVALHPKCPCSRNTLTELEQLLATNTQPTKCTFLMLLPSDASTSWIDTDTVHFAKSLPSSETIVDLNSTRAEQLGLNHSGSMLVLQSDGTVSFRGGITSGRTCSAGNPGLDAVSRLLGGESVDAITTPTFGCALRSSQAMVGVER